MKSIRPELHDLIGGFLCLDFANTKNGHRGMIFHEVLFDYRDLVKWGFHIGILVESESVALRSKADEHPGEAELAFQKAISLREVIFRIFSTLAGRAMPESGDLEALQAINQESIENSQLIPDGKHFRYAFKNETALDRVTWSIANSAVELLTSEMVERVRECEGKDCDWLFIDNSRNHLRRWCSMEECGNRSKMRRRYVRQKKLSS